MQVFRHGRRAWRHSTSFPCICEAGIERPLQRRLFSDIAVLEVDKHVRADLDQLAAARPTPVSLHEVLDTREKWRMAKFIQKEVPIRLAERVRAIESLADWKDVSDLVDVHSRLVKAFVELRAVKRDRKLTDFSCVAKETMRLEKGVIELSAKGMQTLRGKFPERYSEEFADKFLNDFLLNRIGSTVLINQYLAHPHGVIDPRCNVRDVCRKAARQVEVISKEVTGSRPLIHVEAHSAVEGDHEVPRFSYIPSFLHYIMCELLKNSSRATLAYAGSQDKCSQDHNLPWLEPQPANGIEGRPISVVICADERRVVIRVSDRAGGIPFDVGKRVWSYTYTTAIGDRSPLAGHGVGLPLSRLYAWYLGGSLDLVSMPGYGTDAFLFLPRITSELVEVVPDADYEFHRHDLTNFTVN